MNYPKYYLAYGSNLNLAQMKQRCPTSKKVGTAIIKDYRLLFKRTYLTIEPAEGYEVPVGVLEIWENDERALDYYEGYPDFYCKKGFEIVLNGSSRRLNAFAYIMDESYRFELPSPIYVETVRQGYADFGFDFSSIEEAIAYSDR